MKSKILNYLIFALLTMLCGLLSRHFKFIPLFIGDILWATMIYFIVRFIQINKSVKISVIVSLLFCYVIELSQLYKAPWINSLRRTIFGRLVLGDHFLWTDLVCYTAGVFIGLAIDKLTVKQV